MSGNANLFAQSDSANEWSFEPLHSHNNALKTYAITFSKVKWTTATNFNAGTKTDVQTNGTGDTSTIGLTEIADSDNDIPYTTQGNYTLSDSDKLEVSGGDARHKDQRPADATFYASYNSDINGNWGDGDLTGTAVGGASVTDGYLDLDEGDSRYVDYDADLNADSQQQGCIRIRVTPQYSGNPSGFQHYCSIFKAAGDYTNLIRMYHSPIGNFHCQIYDQSKVQQLNMTFAWSPTSGVEYELEFNYASGGNYIYLDGVRKNTNSSTFTRNADIGVLRVGQNYTGPTTPAFHLNDLLIFSTVQHTAANYTPDWSGIKETIYSTDDNLYIDTKDASQISLSDLAAWLTCTITNSKPANTDIRLLFSNNGRSSWLTWNGSAWAAPASATTRTDAASITDAQTNFSSLPTGDKKLDVRLFLNTSDGAVRPTVSNINVTGDSGYETSGTWESNEYNSTILSQDWGKLTFATDALPAGTTMTIQARAGNQSGSLGDYSSALVNNEETNLTGQYLQIKVSFTTTVNDTALLNWVATNFDLPTVREYSGG